MNEATGAEERKGVAAMLIQKKSDPSSKGKPWVFMTFGEGRDGQFVRPHFVTEDLAETIAADIEDRYGSKVEERKDMRWLNVESGGISPANGAWVSFDADGFVFGCSAYDFPAILGDIKHRVRFIGGKKPHVKVYFLRVCACMPCGFHESLVAEMEKNKQEVIAIGSAEAGDGARSLDGADCLHESVVKRAKRRAAIGGGGDC